MDKSTEEKLVEMIQIQSDTMRKLMDAMELISDNMKALQTRIRILERQTPSVNIVSKN